MDDDESWLELIEISEVSLALMMSSI